LTIKKEKKSRETRCKGGNGRKEGFGERVTGTFLNLKENILL
jgi:hypothetical protein